MAEEEEDMEHGSIGSALEEYGFAAASPQWMYTQYHKREKSVAAAIKDW